MRSEFSRCSARLVRRLVAVMFYEYDNANDAEVGSLLREIDFGRLVTVAADETPPSRLMARSQPEGGFRTVGASDWTYASMLAKLVAVTLDVQQIRAKFKLAQNRTTTVRKTVASRLRHRARPRD